MTSPHDENAAAVVYLASDKARLHITGTTIAMDGAANPEVW